MEYNREIKNKWIDGNKMKTRVENKMVEILQLLRRQNIYYIKINGGMCGFFAMLREALDFLCYAEEINMIPYIVYDKSNLYAEEKGFRGTKNVFEYYFIQPMKVNYFIYPWNTNVVKSNYSDRDKIELKYNGKEFSYIVEESYLNKMAYIYGKYIRLLPYIKKYIYSSIRKKINARKTLGVHIRGTDFNKSFNRHPVPVTIDEYIEKIQKAVGEYGYEQIFIATDDERSLEEIKEKISLPIVYYEDVTRSKNNKSVAFSRSNRENDRYLLGLEVLRDVYTLAACSGFIGCLSQIDIFVQIIKKSRGKRYQYFDIINHGVFSNNKDCWEALT